MWARRARNSEGKRGREDVKKEKNKGEKEMCRGVFTPDSRKLNHHINCQIIMCATERVKTMQRVDQAVHEDGQFRQNKEGLREEGGRPNTRRHQRAVGGTLVQTRAGRGGDGGGRGCCSENEKQTMENKKGMKRESHEAKEIQTR